MASDDKDALDRIVDESIQNDLREAGWRGGSSDDKENKTMPTTEKMRRMPKRGSNRELRAIRYLSRAIYGEDKAEANLSAAAQMFRKALAEAGGPWP